MTGPAEDPHTLDEYMDALRFAAPRLPAGVESVRRLVWGGRGGRAPTELALEELVAQGRATRTDGWRYRACPAACVDAELEAENEAPSPPVAAELAPVDVVGPSTLPAPAEHEGEDLASAADPAGDGFWIVYHPRRTTDDVADKHAPERVIADAKALESGDDDESADGALVHDAPAETTPEASAADDDREPDAEVVQALLPPPRFETLADVAAKWADPESVVAAARELRPRLEAARERLRQRLSERMAVVTADRELLVELDGYSQALGGGEGG